MNDSLIALAIIAIPSTILVLNNVKRQLTAAWFILSSMALLLLDYTGINTTVGAIVLLVGVVIPFFYFSVLALMSIWDNKAKLIPALLVVFKYAQPVLKLVMVTLAYAGSAFTYLLSKHKEEEESQYDLEAKYNTQLSNHYAGIVDPDIGTRPPVHPSVNVARNLSD